MDTCLIRSAPQLYDVIYIQNNKNKTTKTLPKYEYPDALLRFNDLQDFNANGVDFKINFNEAHFVRGLDCQKKLKKSIYGSAFLISNKKLKEKQEKQRNLIKSNKITKPIKWELSEREKEIIRNLD